MKFDYDAFAEIAFYNCHCLSCSRYFVRQSVLDDFYLYSIKQSALSKVFTEVLVLISLFSAGVKMSVPGNFYHWCASLRLAAISMVLTVGLMDFYLL